MPLKEGGQEEGFWACDDGVLDMFGGKRPWKESEWTAVDDRVRGGRSRSQLSVVYPTEARFYGNLDIDTLGGAGFASQATRRDKVGPWNLKTYDGIAVKIQDCDDMIYTISVKDTTSPYKKPDPDDPPDDEEPENVKPSSNGRSKAKPSTVTWEVHLRFRSTPRPNTPPTAGKETVKAFMLSGAGNNYRHSSSHTVPEMTVTAAVAAEVKKESNRGGVASQILEKAFATAFKMGGYRDPKVMSSVVSSPNESMTNSCVSVMSENNRAGGGGGVVVGGEAVMMPAPFPRDPIPEFSNLAIDEDTPYIDVRPTTTSTPNTPNTGKKLSPLPTNSNNNTNGDEQAKLDKYYSAQYTIPLDDTQPLLEGYFIPFSAFRPYYRGKPLPDYHRPLRRGKIRSLSLMVRSHFGKQSGRFSNHIDRMVAYDIDSFRSHARVQDAVRLTKATEALMDYTLWDSSNPVPREEEDGIGVHLAQLITWGGTSSKLKKDGDESVSSAEDNVVADWNLIDDGEIENAKRMRRLEEEDEDRKKNATAGVDEEGKYNCVIM